MSLVLITGGSGLIGRALQIRLEEKGHDVAVLSRKGNKNRGKTSFAWDIERGEIDREALNNSEYIIHLAGANIGAKRWTRKRKREIRSSRIDSTHLLFANLDQQKNKLKAFISSSAIGYYGATNSDHIFSETDPPSSDFLGQICRDWEHAADQFPGGLSLLPGRTALS